MRNRFLSLVLMLLCALPMLAQSDSVRIVIKTANGYRISLDNGAPSGNVLRVWTRMGKHKVCVTDNNGFRKEWDIEVGKDTGTEFNFPLEGTTRVSANKPATVWVDGELVGDAPLELRLVGKHRITIDAGYDYKMTKQEIVFNPLEDRDINVVMQKARPKLYGFIIANYMITAQAPGLMMGVGRRFGVFAKANVGINGLDFADSEFPENSLGVVRRYYTEQYEHKPRYQGGSIGLSYRPVKFLSLYAGAGYAQYAGANVIEIDSEGYEDILCSETIKGVQIDAGVILKWKALLLQAGYTRLLSSSRYGHHYGDFNVGLGITMHKNKKRVR